MFPIISVQLCTARVLFVHHIVAVKQRSSSLFLNISHKTYFCSSGDRAFRLLLLRTVFTSWSIGSMMGHNRSPGYLQTHLSLRCRIFNISEILPASQTCISLYHVDDTIQYKITWTNVKTQTRKHFKTLRTQLLISPKRL